tara:strand:- start:4355 stop:5041 length:687 start_codon:yes stop_codon:yes gene_type:complete
MRCVFLTPIDHRGIQGKLFPQWLRLQQWCDANDSAILSVDGMFLNFARNHLASGGGGFAEPTPPEADWLFWIDSDIQFTIRQVEDLLSIDPEKKFVTGWYRASNNDFAMVGDWNEDYFRRHHHMPFLSAKGLTKLAKADPDKVLPVDWCGFGFTKVHRSVYEQMEYPYFTLNSFDIEETSYRHKHGEFSAKDLVFEDISFCQNCYKATGIRPQVVPRIKVNHLKSSLV